MSYANDHNLTGRDDVEYVRALGRRIGPLEQEVPPAWLDNCIESELISVPKSRLALTVDVACVLALCVLVASATGFAVFALIRAAVQLAQS